MDVPQEGVRMNPMSPAMVINHPGSGFKLVIKDWLTGGGLIIVYYS